MKNKIDDQIQDILGSLPERFIIAEETIDPTAQQEYLDYTETIDLDQYTPEEILARSHRLFSPDTSLEDKKKTLATLAHNGTPESYKIIEKYLRASEGKLRDWGALALEECRMFLEGSLRDENVGAIMAGLGGKGNRMRYFFAVRSRNGMALTDAQRKAVELSFSYIGHRLNSIVEETHFYQAHATMLALIPLDVAVAEFAEGGIRQCNQVDECLDVDYYVRNDRIPTEDEILKWM